MATVLLIEDYEKLNTINRMVLESENYRVLAAQTLAEARALLKKESPDVILLDVLLPDGDGFGFCEEIRNKTDAHILFLTSKSDHADKMRGLSNGGDDYITKPYQLEELLARVNAAVRRRAMTPVPVVTKGPLVLDALDGRATLHGKDLLLTPKEFSILHLLMQSADRPLSTEAIYEHVWKQSMYGDDHSVKNTVYRLRKKLENDSDGLRITVVRGEGYRLVHEE